MRDFPEGFEPLSQLEVKALEASARAKQTKKRAAFGREAMATLRGIALLAVLGTVMVSQQDLSGLTMNQLTSRLIPPAFFCTLLWAGLGIFLPSGLMLLKEKLRDVAVDALPEPNPESPAKGVV